MGAANRTLSVCLIVKNEAAVLGNCLSDAAAFADEIIVADTGSTDDTKEIARRFTDKVFDVPWREDFSAARNASFERASCDYLMWLDADDRIDEENRQKIRQWKQAPTGKLIFAGYERPENGGTFLYPRIVRRDAGFTWEGIIHEHLVLTQGQLPLKPEDCVTGDFVIRHCKQGAPNYSRNIQIMERLSEEELRSSFWLCAQCFLDCVLAGETEKAERYLRLAAESRTPFENRLEDYALINAVLKFHRQYDAMLKWHAMYLTAKALKRGRT